MGILAGDTIVIQKEKLMKIPNRCLHIIATHGIPGSTTTEKVAFSAPRDSSLLQRWKLMKYKLMIGQCIHIEYKSKNSWYHSLFTLNTKLKSHEV
ncbi:hypothetical protein OUZ56_010327 [Daphnia magna]|uniref:Uncharacterized protein n=1 Tax=Daphnia magna TaxID=35525 RepID=A0ABR0AIC9_9CRUS|nr:hypothetical protein OUZ56_010327 [Daphnia magna]